MTEILGDRSKRTKKQSVFVDCRWCTHQASCLRTHHQTGSLYPSTLRTLETHHNTPLRYQTSAYAFKSCDAEGKNNTTKSVRWCILNDRENNTGLTLVCALCVCVCVPVCLIPSRQPSQARLGASPALPSAGMETRHAWLVSPATAPPTPSHQTPETQHMESAADPPLTCS